MLIRDEVVAIVCLRKPECIHACYRAVFAVFAVSRILLSSTLDLGFIHLYFVWRAAIIPWYSPHLSMSHEYFPLPKGFLWVTNERRAFQGSSRAFASSIFLHLRFRTGSLLCLLSCAFVFGTDTSSNDLIIRRVSLVSHCACAYGASTWGATCSSFVIRLVVSPSLVNEIRWYSRCILFTLRPAKITLIPIHPTIILI